MRMPAARKVEVGVASAFPSSGGCSLAVSFVYVLACRLFELVVLLGRGERDRLLLAALSRALPRRS